MQKDVKLNHIKTEVDTNDKFVLRSSSFFDIFCTLITQTDTKTNFS